MTPQEFLAKVVEPNLAAQLDEPGDLRLACNTILSADALAGCIYDHLKTNDPSSVVAFRDDSQYKESIAQSAPEFRIIRDAAFTLKHGGLRPANRVVFDIDAFSEGPNTFGFFHFGDRFGGGLVYLDVQQPTLARVRADHVVRTACKTLEGVVAGLP